MSLENEYCRTLGAVNDALVGGACGLTPLSQKNMEDLACFIRLVLNGQTFEQAKAAASETSDGETK